MGDFFDDDALDFTLYEDITNGDDSDVNREYECEFCGYTSYDRDEFLESHCPMCDAFLDED